MINIAIKDEIFTILCYVIEDSCFTDDMISERNFLDQADLTVIKGVIQIRKLEDLKFETNPFENIDIVKLNEEDTEGVKLDHIKDSRIRKAVGNLIKDYKPDKPSPSNVRLKINLEDEVPVYQRARRLAPIEKSIVNGQIQE